MWIVSLQLSESWVRAYGPFDDEDLAARFARFVSEEVDPAKVVKVHSPVVELLNWRDHERKSSPLDDQHAGWMLQEEQARRD